MVDDDDDEFDDGDIPGFSHPTIAQSESALDKGKSRAHDAEQLASPSANARLPTPALSGKIGSAPSAGASRPTRQTVGGMRVETR